MAKRLFLLIFVFFLISPLVSFQKRSTKGLSSKYKKWLEEDVLYIISMVEKEVFSQLKSDRERDLFIEAFWKHRDPTPGTPENEFRNEHYRRINYANFHFGSGTSKPGWKTRRGEIYIILGEPRDIQRYSGESSLYDTEVWFYQGLTEYGLPPAFNLLFFQKGGVGEHILYSPITHGPQALMISYRGDPTNYLKAYRELRRIDPELAQTSLSLVPGEETRYGQPSLSSDILIQNVQNVPQRQINDRYASKFLEYKDIVEVEYSANYIDSDSSVKIIQDESGINFVHYAIELKKFSVQQFENKFSTHLKLNGHVRNQEGKTVYQYEGSFTIDLDESRLKEIANIPFNLYDMFPLISGDYTFSVILKNEVSKEFTTLERSIFIPEEVVDSKILMGQLILGYKLDTILSKKHKMSPFQIGVDQIYHQPNKVYHPQERLFIAFQIKGLNPELSERGKIRYEFYKDEELFLIESREVSTLKEGVNFKEGFPLQNFGPAHYKVKVSLWFDDREMTSQTEEFAITSVAAIPRPWIYKKELPPTSHPSYALILGRQYLNKKEIDKARINFETAYYKNPNSRDFALELARIYLIQQKYKKAKDILLPFSKEKEVSYQVLFILGKSYQALSEYGQAINIYNKAVTHFGVNVDLLNSLGECSYSLGNTDDALDAWEKSLEINPDQPDIKRKIDAIKRIQISAKKIYFNEQGFLEAEFSYGIIMVYIPEGTFIMGTTKGEDKELPLHSVYLSGYWIGKYPVTVAQFRVFVEETNYKTDSEKGEGSWIEEGGKIRYDVSWDKPNFKQGDNHPVICVSWNDANAYSEWLSRKIGIDFCLPTEAQWEKAARGTDQRTYPWGNQIPDGSFANFADLNYRKRFGRESRNSDASVNDGYAQTSPVNAYPKGQSPYGVFDMAGNTIDWLYDWFDPEYYSKSPPKNPTGPVKNIERKKHKIPGGWASNLQRCIRGGAWTDASGELSLSEGGHSIRSDMREHTDQFSSDDHLGFRLAIDNICRKANIDPQSTENGVT